MILSCKILLLWAIILFVTPKVSSKIKHCNETTEIGMVCYKGPRYYPDRPALPWPAKIQVYFNILDIVDIDWNSNTLTQFIQLWSLWNDSRIFVKGGDDQG